MNEVYLDASLEVNFLQFLRGEGYTVRELDEGDRPDQLLALITDSLSSLAFEKGQSINLQENIHTIYTRPKLDDADFEVFTRNEDGSLRDIYNALLNLFRFFSTATARMQTDDLAIKKELRELMFQVQERNAQNKLVGAHKQKKQMTDAIIMRVAMVLFELYEVKRAISEFLIEVVVPGAQPAANAKLIAQQLLGFGARKSSTKLVLIAVIAFLDTAFGLFQPNGLLDVLLKSLGVSSEARKLILIAFQVAFVALSLSTLIKGSIKNAIKAAIGKLTAAVGRAATKVAVKSAAVKAAALATKKSVKTAVGKAVQGVTKNSIKTAVVGAVKGALRSVTTKAGRKALKETIQEAVKGAVKSIIKNVKTLLRNLKATFTQAKKSTKEAFVAAKESRKTAKESAKKAKTTAREAKKAAKETAKEAKKTGKEAAKNAKKANKEAQKEAYDKAAKEGGDKAGKAAAKNVKKEQADFAKDLKKQSSLKSGTDLEKAMNSRDALKQGVTTAVVSQTVDILNKSSDDLAKLFGIEGGEEKMAFRLLLTIAATTLAGKATSKVGFKSSSDGFEDAAEEAIEAGVAQAIKKGGKAAGESARANLESNLKALKAQKNKLKDEAKNKAKSEAKKTAKAAGNNSDEQIEAAGEAAGQAAFDGAREVTTIGALHQLQKAAVMDMVGAMQGVLQFTTGMKDALAKIDDANREEAIQLNDAIITIFSELGDDAGSQSDELRKTTEKAMGAINKAISARTQAFAKARQTAV
ncbi:MAG: colicin import membrane protein [Chlamydiales bacterium]|jgi:colicin import membrane protein